MSTNETNNVDMDDSQRSQAGTTAQTEAVDRETSVDSQAPEPKHYNTYTKENGADDSLSTGAAPDSLTSSGDATGKPPPSDAHKEPEPEASRTRLQTVIIMLSLCSSVFLAALDTTIITTALPTISEHFHSSSGYTWIGSAYLLANAASTPSWGKFSDIWGRKPILLCAAGIFWIGSLLAGLSVSISMLITARAIQGIGGGGLIVLVNICISDLFSMRNRGKYFGMVGMVWALASAVGPILGGIFTEKVSWRWCFYINLPITGTAFIVLCLFLQLDNPRTPVWDGLKAVDWIGSFTIIGGTLMILLGLELGGVTYPWRSAKIICLIVFGALVAGLFTIWEWNFAKYPVMPSRIFKYRSNLAALGVCFCHGFVFIAGTYYLPLYFQAVLGAPPLLSGVYLLPLALSLSFMSAGTGLFIKKTGKYLPCIWFGLTVMCVGFGLFIDLDVTENWPKIIIFQIIAGIGVGPNFQSPLIALQTKVAPRDIATATATFGFVRNLSTAISVVVGGVVFQNEMQKRYQTLVDALGRATANLLSGNAAGASIDIVKALPPAERAVAREAFIESLRTMWILYVSFAALGIIISIFVGDYQLSKEHVITKTGLAEEEANRKEFLQTKRKAKESAEKESGNGSEELVAKEEV